MKKAASLLSINEIFENRYFIVPDYQRGYSWEERQLKDLQNDINNLIIKSVDYKHFTGTIVAARNKDDHDTFEIVDGQQRLISLIILLKRIYELNREKYSYLNELFFRRGEIGRERSVFTPNSETRDYFEERLFKGVSPKQENKSHENLNFAIEFMKDWISGQNADDILKAVSENIGFILFTPENSKEIGIMFEVINNRGKKLSELEKLKNFFIYYSIIHDRDTLRELINRDWQEILKNLSLAKKTSNDDEDSFVRFCYLVFYESNKEKSYVVYEQMKLKYEPNQTDTNAINASVKEIENFVSFMKSSSLNYTYFFKSGHYDSFRQKDIEDTKRIDVTLKYLRCHNANASIMPMYLAIMNSKNQSTSERSDMIENRIANLLELIEKLNFRLYVLPKIVPRTDSRQGNVYYFANQFFKKTSLNESNGELPKRVYQSEADFLSAANIFDWLANELKAMICEECPPRRIVEALTLDLNETFNFYDWADGLRFFFSCYEEMLSKKTKRSYDIERMLKKRKEVRSTLNDYLSIEHIWAQKNRKDDFPETELQKRRLGNLVLMGLPDNITLQKEDIPEKVKEMQELNSTSGAIDLHQVAKLSDYLERALENTHVQSYQRYSKNYWRDMATAICDLRETDLIRFALEKWSLPDDNIDILDGIDSFKARDNKDPEVYKLRSNVENNLNTDNHE